MLSRSSVQSSWTKAVVCSSISSLPFLACANFNIVMGGGRGPGEEWVSIVVKDITPGWAGWPGLGTGLELRNVLLWCELGLVWATRDHHTLHWPSLSLSLCVLDGRKVIFIDCDLSRSLKINLSLLSVIFLSHTDWVLSSNCIVPKIKQEIILSSFLFIIYFCILRSDSMAAVPSVCGCHQWPRCQCSWPGPRMMLHILVITRVPGPRHQAPVSTSFFSLSLCIWAAQCFVTLTGNSRGSWVAAPRPCRSRGLFYRAGPPGPLTLPSLLPSSAREWWRPV